MSNILDFLNPFSENFILKGIIEFLGEILSYLNPFDEKFFGYKLVEMLGDLLKALFIPSEQRIVSLTETVTNKFSFIDSIKFAINSIKDLLNNTGTAPSLSLELSATKYTDKQTVKIIDFSWYKPFKPYGDLVLTGFIYVMFIWRMYITLPNIISGAGGYVSSSINIDDFLSRKEKG